MRCPALCLALAGCAGAAEMIGAPPETPQLVYQSWEASDLDREGVTLKVHYAIRNPNGYPLRLAGLDYRVDVEGRQALSGALGGGLAIPARGSVGVAIPVRIRFADVPGVAAALLEKDQIAWRISGTATVDLRVGTVAIPFAQDGRLDTPGRAIRKGVN